MKTELPFDPLDHVLDACADYKLQLFGMLDPEKREENRMEFLLSAKEYKKAVRAAIRSLRYDLKQIDLEVESFTN